MCPLFDLWLLARNVFQILHLNSMGMRVGMKHPYPQQYAALLKTNFFKENTKIYNYCRTKLEAR